MVRQALLFWKLFCQLAYKRVKGSVKLKSRVDYLSIILVSDLGLVSTGVATRGLKNLNFFNFDRGRSKLDACPDEKRASTNISTGFASCRPARVLSQQGRACDHVTQRTVHLQVPFQMLPSIIPHEFLYVILVSSSDLEGAREMHVCFLTVRLPHFFQTLLVESGIWRCIKQIPAQNTLCQMLCDDGTQSRCVNPADIQGQAWQLMQPSSLSRLRRQSSHKYCLSSGKILRARQSPLLQSSPTMRSK